MGRGTEAAQKWRKIPSETDVLITHTPPAGHGDLIDECGRAGCVDLLAEVTERVRPLYHVFGHVHDGFGVTTDGTTRFLNAASVSDSYHAANPPLVFELPPAPGYEVSAPGTSVELVGLEKRPELNGRAAMVIELNKKQLATHPDACRLPVVLPGQTKPILVRKANLRRVASCQSRLAEVCEEFEILVVRCE